MKRSFSSSRSSPAMRGSRPGPPRARACHSSKEPPASTRTAVCQTSSISTRPTSPRRMSTSSLPTEAAGTSSPYWGEVGSETNHRSSRARGAAEAGYPRMSPSARASR
eukprot:8122344-Pyramimonas_sp.AAC.1